MIQDICTLEIAKLYERQGYFKEALETYLSLDGHESRSEIQAGITRMTKKMETAGEQKGSEDNLSFLLEEWLMLMVLRHRLNHFIKIKKRLT